MAEVAREMKVATQMGNQGTADDGLRQSAAIIQAGALGTVNEVHVWTNRPIWPQGGPRPEPSRVPKHLHWDVWLGPAPDAALTATAIIRSPGAAGGISAPAPWATWPATPMNMPFMALDLRDPVVGEAADLGPQQRELSQVVDHPVRVPGHRQAAGGQTDLVRRQEAAAGGIVREVKWPKEAIKDCPKADKAEAFETSPRRC